MLRTDGGRVPGFDPDLESLGADGGRVPGFDPDLVRGKVRLGLGLGSGLSVGSVRARLRAKGSVGSG